MKLYVIQHGNPVPKEDNPDRPLSIQGERDVRKIALYLEEHAIRLQEILHSGKTRARQTAEIMMSALNPDADLVKRGGLSPLDDPNLIVDYIKDRQKDLMIVGHLPHLSKLVSLLVSGSESVSVVTFQQGGVVCLERKKEGDWTVVWMIIPDMV